MTHHNQSPDEKQKRRLLSHEKKFQIFLESHAGETPQEGSYDEREFSPPIWGVSDRR